MPHPLHYVTVIQSNWMQLLRDCRGKKAVWQRPCDLLNVEFVLGVRKYVIWGVVVYSNVRASAPMSGFHAPPYLPPSSPYLAFPFPSTYSLLSTTCCFATSGLETLPNTRNFNLFFDSAQKHSYQSGGFLLCVLSVRSGDFFFLS